MVILAEFNAENLFVERFTMADTNVILKYRRPEDKWLCPECDAENALSYGNCSVCGCIRVPTSPIIKAWSEMDERPMAGGYMRPPYGTAPISTPVTRAGMPGRIIGGSSTPVFVDPDRASGKPMYVEEKSNSGAVILWTVAIILLVVVLAIIFMNI